MTSQQPPFKIPPTIKNGSKYHWVERKIVECSDGDQTKRPPADSGSRAANFEFYLCHLGQQWALKDGLAEQGVHYYINKLPSGYAMFESNQPGGMQVYKRLFGHPSGRFYDSAIKFEPHFLWLMSEMDDDCECTLCSQKPLKPRLHRLETARPMLQRIQSGDTTDEEQYTSALSNIASSLASSRRSRRRNQQLRHERVKDEEGNDDIYKDCIRNLQSARTSNKITEIDLAEKNSIDWRAERGLLPQSLAQLEQQHSFVPRVGELVLWCTAWPSDHHLIFDAVTMSYKLYSFRKKQFCGFPKWRGGVIATAPSGISKSGSVDFSDILDATAHSNILSDSGFRVETMSDPNEDFDKSVSKQYMHIPLRYIRPLSHWKLLLRGTPAMHRHVSIQYALTCMTTISLLEKWLFLGYWPDGSILCKAIYLGSELITVGDAVRILRHADHGESHGSACRDILIVSSIRYNLEAIDSQHVAAETPALSDKSSVTIVGQAFTTDAYRAHNSAKDHIAAADESAWTASESCSVVKELFRPIGSDEYGSWYPLHSPNQKLEISHENVLGRLHEAHAVRLWLGQREDPTCESSPKASLDFDADGINAGRVYASASDARLPEPQRQGEVNWFLADTRAEALAITSFNGIDFINHQGIRTKHTLDYWRNAIKIIDGRDSNGNPSRDDLMVSWNDVKFDDIEDPNMSEAEEVDITQPHGLNKRRRGRPPGSKLVNGKLVLPGQAQNVLNHSADREDFVLSAHMAAAVLRSDTEIDDPPSGKERVDVGTPKGGRPLGSKFVDGKLVLPGEIMQRKQPLDKWDELKLSSRMADTALTSDSDHSQGTKYSPAGKTPRRGRPVGSKLVNGKLVLAEQLVLAQNQLKSQEGGEPGEWITDPHTGNRADVANHGNGGLQDDRQENDPRVA